MSGLAKAVKKVWRPIEKLGSKITNVATLGLHNKTKKIRHKIIKSKIFKVVVAAVAIYFGGAALLSMAGGGTASAGIGSAWAGAQGAGSALAAGNFSGAASALGSGFTGGAAAGATGTFAAGQAATASTLTGSTVAAPALTGGALTTSGVTAATPAAQSGLAGYGLSTTAPGAVAGSAGSAIGTGTTAASGGLLSGLGEAGKAALITGGINMAGSMIAGKAEADAADEERKRRTYWGVDGDGNQVAGGGGLLNPANYINQPAVQPPQQQSWQTSLDGLINRQKQLLGQG